MKSTFSIAAIAIIVGLNVAHAQNNLVITTQALVVIENAASSICYNISQGGGETKTTTIVNGAMDQVADLHVTGSGELDTENYRGVVRSELSATLRTSQDCKKSVFDSLVIRMIPTLQAETGLPISQGVHLRPRTNEQPSIDCNNTNEPVELLLCADADLALWDGRMGQIYRQRMQQQLNQQSQQALRQSQRDWIKARYVNCNVPKTGAWSTSDLAPAKPCILEMTKRRVADLTK